MHVERVGSNHEAVMLLIAVILCLSEWCFYEACINGGFGWNNRISQMFRNLVENVVFADCSVFEISQEREALGLLHL